MKLYIDSANIQEIEKALIIYPIAGVTTNPNLLVKEQGDYIKTLKAIEALLTDEQDFHIQLVGETEEEMLMFAKNIELTVSEQVIFKVPVTEVGMKVIKELRKQNKRVTATAVHTETQAYLASMAGAEFVAPYFNRIENEGGNASKTIREISQMINNTEILAASFKNRRQVADAILNGAKIVTVPYVILQSLVENHASQAAIDDFQEKWDDTYGK